MKDYTLTDDIESILYTKEQIAARTRELAAEIERDYKGKTPVMLCLLKGSCVFFADICRELDLKLTMDFMSVSTYGNGTTSSGVVHISKDMETDIAGKDVIIVEDIIDSGITLSHLVELLNERKPASLKIVCLLDKPERRELPIKPDYCGFVIPNLFVVGYGLDYAQHYRNLPFVGVLKPEMYS